MKKYTINILLLIVGLALFRNTNVYAQSNRWGNHSSISKTSLTLDGVKPKANWIWNSGEENPRNYFLLIRKTFNLNKRPDSAIAFISAYAYADVYINGKLFERCPRNGDPEYQNYDKFDIKNYLQKGKNSITAIVQNFGIGLHSQMNARGGFFFQGKLHYPNRSIDLLSDSSWK